MDDRRFRDAVLKPLPLKQLSNNETQYFNVDMEEDFPVLLEPARPISTKSYHVLAGVDAMSLHHLICLHSLDSFQTTKHSIST